MSLDGTVNDRGGQDRPQERSFHVNITHVDITVEAHLYSHIRHAQPFADITYVRVHCATIHTCLYARMHARTDTRAIVHRHAHTPTQVRTHTRIRNILLRN